MPKKKPIAKRLNKLFDDIKHEEPSAEELAEIASESDARVKEAFDSARAALC